MVEKREMGSCEERNGLVDKREMDSCEERNGQWWIREKWTVVGKRERDSFVKKRKLYS